MGVVSDKIKECAANPILGDRMFRTTYRVLEVPGFYHNGQILYGRLDPSQHLDPSSVQAESDSYVRRYGPGAGAPYVRQEGIGQAISVVPDAMHALQGLGLEEGTYYPAQKALAFLGVTSLSWEDRVDLEACVDFNDLVIRCIDMDLPLGTDRAHWPKPPEWHPPVQGPTPQQGPAQAPPTTAPVAAAPAAAGPLPLDQILAALTQVSQLASVVSNLQAEVSAIRKGGTGVSSPAVLPLPTQPLPTPTSTSVAAVMGPLAASASSILAELNQQVGPTGGGHWAQLLRGLCNSVRTAKDQLGG